MNRVDDADDEFRFREEEAVEFGIPLPLQAAARASTNDAEHRRVSFIRYGDGRPVVTFLHGAALNAHTWDATAAALGTPAVALDLPGHGCSEWRDDADYRPETLAASLSSVIRGFAGPRLLVGQSLGGLTSALIAAEDPATAGLILVDITPGVSADETSPVAAFLAGPTDFARRDDVVEAARSAGIGVSRESVARGVALNTCVRDDGRVVFTHHLGNLSGMSPSLRWDPERLWRVLGDVAVPVWLVRARRGLVSDERVREFTGRLPRAHVIELDTGHNVQEDDPVALARVITDVLSSLEESSRTSELPEARA
ncbi:alpha/beta fold hydrolase [Paramicrobacterium agarici]|uniref:Pimeloyl-ACP methyl ester carboxylesterase n=1 Tax=Paramicrobacterium agarici TaxID=630514 RepID=A0A2A9DY88_9MICO|nr:alpha/beta hydrolase [Microbacterium agarici]PFG30899.1 pimeloyl-ACP methyl ester carboxylesterase [Microbacterium agarici]